MKKNLIKVLLLIIVTSFFVSCSKDHHLASKTFVLVHGAWQAPYVWNTVKSELEKAGQKVIVVELPAHGADFTSPAAVSIDVYSQKVISAVQSVQGKVILVGHSLGGMVVTDVAEKIPSKIEKLVYLAGFVPENGQSLLDLANQDAQSLLGPALIPSKDQLTLDIRKDAITSIFCQDGNDAVKQLVLNNFRPEPAIPFKGIHDANLLPGRKSVQAHHKYHANSYSLQLYNV